MKKILLALTFCFIYFVIPFQGSYQVWAQSITPAPVTLPPPACPDPNNPQQSGYCPGQDTGLQSAYASRGERCPTGNGTAAQYADYLQNPTTVHLWVEDPHITDQGKADERARQFAQWTLNIKEPQQLAAPLSDVWQISRNIAIFLTVLVAAIMGLGYIIGQRTSFQTNIKIWPSLFKLGSSLLYIALSAALVFTLIQLSELLMKFFIENLGAKDLFNIYFTTTDKSSEGNYLNFIGCRDLNLRVQEGANAELFLLNLTNITYYILGTMIILRKIVLWFMLFVAPFLPILLIFNFIRNIGLIWIGVFFQWLFYGPLLALFLGATALIWKSGIPFSFDFSRVANLDSKGYIYPTAINIIYGGPAQQLQNPLIALKNGNYVDTFVEYVISLIMLWAVIFFPWWLLRIFRDYCCDGIYAMKNILLSMYDQTRNGGSPPPPIINPSVSPAGTTIKTKNEIVVPLKIKLETIEEIKKAQTTDIARSMNLSATKLSDVAQYEMNSQSQLEIKKNIDLLSNPMQASTPTERQKYMNIRTELFNRAIKEDKIAKQILSVTSNSHVEQQQARANLLQAEPRMMPVSQAVSSNVNIPQDRVSSITSTITNVVTTNNNALTTVATQTQTSIADVQNILTAFKQNINQPPQKIVQSIATQTGVGQEKVTQVITQVGQVLKKNKELAQEIAKKEHINEQDVEKIVDAQIPLVTETQKHIEQAISIPQTISIDDYEDVKTMWTKQYEKGEVPVSENIKSRDEWVDQDIVFMTNTLNKLVAPDEKLKLEGLDEVGYILPIFMINNLKGEELLVYLKAKLEAAKEVQKELSKEKEITNRLEQKQKEKEDLVDVEKPKAAEAEKTMEMKEEQPIPPEDKKEPDHSL